MWDGVLLIYAAVCDTSILVSHTVKKEVINILYLLLLLLQHRGELGLSCYTTQVLQVLLSIKKLPQNLGITVTMYKIMAYPLHFTDSANAECGLQNMSGQTSHLQKILGQLAQIAKFSLLKRHLQKSAAQR